MTLASAAAALLAIPSTLPAALLGEFRDKSRYLRLRMEVRSIRTGTFSTSVANTPTVFLLIPLMRRVGSYLSFRDLRFPAAFSRPYLGLTQPGDFCLPPISSTTTSQLMRSTQTPALYLSFRDLRFPAAFSRHYLGLTQPGDFCLPPISSTTTSQLMRSTQTPAL